MAHFDGLQAIAGAELPLTSALYLTRLPDYIFGRTFWLNLAELLRYIWLKFPLVALTNVLVSGEQEASLPAIHEPYYDTTSNHTFFPSHSGYFFFTIKTMNLVGICIISTYIPAGGVKVCPYYRNMSRISPLTFFISSSSSDSSKSGKGGVN